jgi:glyoxylase-like metal-dependent hydrolase (beta-lactamase superfamily II)/rhodanese-related sulfurtransferase
MGACAPRRAHRRADVIGVPQVSSGYYAAMDLELFVTAGVGDTSYLVASDGEAALVDPQRDAWRFLRVAEARGWRVVAVLETHVHNDYLSGALETRAATGAEIVAPARGRYEFAHRPADEGEMVRIGGLTFSALATPGHTPEHLAWAVARDGATVPDGIFTGGSLLVGTAGRTDLLGRDHVAALTADQYRTLRRLGSFPDGARILPTHGAGSFCSAGPAAPSRTSTLGDERANNPIFGALDEVTFRHLLLADLGRWPAYYTHIAPLNRSGPRVVGRLVLPDAMDADALQRATAQGVTIVDGRWRAAFAAAHLPGALNVELTETFAAYVGWVLPFDAPIALVLPDPADASLEEAVSQLFRIGYERVVGYLFGGVDSWAASGRPTSSYPVTTLDGVFDQVARGEDPGTRLLDVRQPFEWRDDGVIPGSTTIFVADLPDRLAELPRDRPITVYCKAGGRAALAASILDTGGFQVRLVHRGGAVGWPERFAALPSR